MERPRVISLRAAAIGTVTALLVGILASLALRPPGTPAARNPAATLAGNTSESVTWKVASAFGTNLPIVGKSATHLSELLKRASANTISLEIYEPSELVPAFSITESIKDGKIEAGWTWVGYDQGKIPASPLLAAVPFGMEPWEFIAWWREGGGNALGEGLYNPFNVQPLLCGISGPEAAGWFRSPVESLEDIKGLKIRFAGLGGKILQELGASVTMMPAGEIFQALEKGAIDATEFSLPVIDQMLGFDRVAKFNYFPGWHQPFSSLHLLVNLEIWTALRADTRATIEMACLANITHSLGRSEALQGPALEAFQASGVTTGTLPDEILRQLQRVSVKLLAKEAEANADFAQILASQRTFSESYKKWKQLGYLPRDF